MHEKIDARRLWKTITKYVADNAIDFIETII